MSDFTNEMNSMSARKSESRRLEEGFRQAWQRLAKMRALLRAEADRQIAQISLLPTDSTEIREDLVLGDYRRMAAARLASHSAKEFRDTHRGRGGAFGFRRLTMLWRVKDQELSGAYETAEAAVMMLEAGVAHRHRVLGRAASDLSSRNAHANDLMLKPTRPILDRISQIDLAMLAARSGDAATQDCLVRWDLDALVKITHIWSRLQQDGRVGEMDWAYYLRAGRPEPSPLPGVEDLLAELKNRMKADSSRRGAEEAVIVDGVWENVEMGDERPAKRQPPLSITDGSV